MRYALWILVAILVIVILLFLTRDNDAIPHATMVVDTVDYKGKGPETGGEGVTISSGVENYKHQPSEDFLGKRYAKCLQMVYEWSDSKLLNTTNGLEGIATMEFVVNNHHHKLAFLEDICVEDEIVKNK